MNLHSPWPDSSRTPPAPPVNAGTWWLPPLWEEVGGCLHPGSPAWLQQAVGAVAYCLRRGQRSLTQPLPAPRALLSSAPKWAEVWGGMEPQAASTRGSQQLPRHQQESHGWHLLQGLCQASTCRETAWGAPRAGPLCWTCPCPRGCLGDGGSRGCAQELTCSKRCCPALGGGSGTAGARAQAGALLDPQQWKKRRTLLHDQGGHLGS